MDLHVSEHKVTTQFVPEVDGMLGTLKRQGMPILMGLMWLRIESSWGLFSDEPEDSLKVSRSLTD
jgi:hypothetical protein